MHNYLITFTDGTSSIYTFTLEELQSFVTLNAAYIVSVEDLGAVEPVYTCPYCGAPFSTQAALDAHIQSQHPVEEPPPPPPCSISISAPGSAQEGATASLSATITNNSPYAQLYKTSMYAGAEFIGSIEDTIPGYSSRTYSGSFVMPARAVTVLVWVEVWHVDHWDYNNSASKVISLEAEVPTFSDFGIRAFSKV